MASPKHFDDLVNNALDFLRRSLELMKDGDLRFSSMFFYQSVELFLKARLLREHWSLIIENPRGADLKEFEKGNFKSVSAKDAIKRLQAIAGEDLLALEQAIKPIAELRNRLIHFHASEIPVRTTRNLPEVGDGEGLQTKEEEQQLQLAIDFFGVFFELRTLLLDRWKTMFAEHENAIALMERRVAELQPYLQAKYDSLSGHLLAIASRGDHVVTCSRCGFKSSVRKILVGGGGLSHCLVCDVRHSLLDISCLDEKCDGLVSLIDEGYGKCDTCGEKFAPADFLEHFTPIPNKYNYLETYVYLCHECESLEFGDGSVVFVEEFDRYTCFGCLAQYETSEMKTCGNCNHSLAGEFRDTTWLGCPMCRY